MKRLNPGKRMYPFILVPKDELEQLNVYFNQAINNWLSDWSFIHDGNINLEIDNAYELGDEKLLEYKEHIYQGNYVYILKSQSTLKIFYDLFCHSLLKRTNDESTYMHGEVFEHLMSEAIDELLDLTFDNASAQDEERNVISYKELLKKGSGAIYMKLGIGNDQTVFIIPRYVYEHLLPEIKSTNKSTELYDINVNKINYSNKLKLNVLLNPTVLNINDLINLAEGDCLVLDHETNMNLNLFVNNEIFTTCRLGKYDKYKAISLVNKTGEI